MRDGREREKSQLDGHEEREKLKKNVKRIEKETDVRICERVEKSRAEKGNNREEERERERERARECVCVRVCVRERESE